MVGASPFPRCPNLAHDQWVADQLAKQAAAKKSGVGEGVEGSFRMQPFVIRVTTSRTVCRERRRAKRSRQWIGPPERSGDFDAEGIHRNPSVGALIFGFGALFFGSEARSIHLKYLHMHIHVDLVELDLWLGFSRAVRAL
jgi:hypothetical protein